MVCHTPFVGNSRAYEDYYCSQAGHGLPVFIGGRNIRGRGLGSPLRGIGRSLIPLLKSGGKALLREGARTGMRVAQDVLSGQNIKSAMKQRARQAGKRLFNQAVGQVAGRTAPPGQPTRKRIKSSTSRRTSLKTSANRKRRQPADIFG